jgi:hypothetical protein
MTLSGDVFDGGDASSSDEASESGSTNGRCESETSSAIGWTCWSDFENPYQPSFNACSRIRMRDSVITSKSQTILL